MYIRQNGRLTHNPNRNLTVARFDGTSGGRGIENPLIFLMVRYARPRHHYHFIIKYNSNINHNLKRGKRICMFSQPFFYHPFIYWMFLEKFAQKRISIINNVDFLIIQNMSTILCLTGILISRISYHMFRFKKILNQIPHTNEFIRFTPMNERDLLIKLSKS